MSKFNVTDLKNKYKSLKAAKEAFNLKARGWDALVEKLNAPTPEHLQQKVIALTVENEALKLEVENIKRPISRIDTFDEVGFWLLDNNFDRSRFSDFSVSDTATKLESSVKIFYKKLAEKYHPDKGGTNEQMANLKLLYDQLMSMVEINEGIGK